MDNLKVIYDIKSIPDDINVDQLYNIMKNGGIVIWDSSNGGKRPRIVQEHNLKLYDVAIVPKEILNEKFEGLIGD